MIRALVIDGQGGRMGAALIEQLRRAVPGAEIIAVGTNSIATATMMKAGAAAGATGEHPVVVNSRNADYILGPLGIVAADSLLGEVTPAMAVAVGQSPAAKILLPTNRCNHYVVGLRDLSLAEAVQKAAAQLLELEAARLTPQ